MDTDGLYLEVNKPEHEAELHLLLRPTKHKALPQHFLYAFTSKIFNINPLLTNTVSKTWSAAVSKLLYHVSKMLGTSCNLNVAAREGRGLFKEVFTGLNIS
jgi:hypothetical protein